VRIATATIEPKDDPESLKRIAPVYILDYSYLSGTTE